MIQVVVTNGVMLRLRFHSFLITDLITIFQLRGIHVHSSVTEEILAFIQSGWVVLLDACSTDLIRGPAYIFKTLELT